MKGNTSQFSVLQERNQQTICQWLCVLSVSVKDSGSMCEVSSIDTPAWATVCTVQVTVQHDSQVTLALSEASDNQWLRTMTPMEDYEDSLSLCRSAYCIDFVILVIAYLDFAAPENSTFFSPRSPPTQKKKRISGAHCHLSRLWFDFITRCSNPPILCCSLL